MVPTRVSHSRSRYPLRWVSLVSVRSCSPAPTRSLTSASINSWASSRTPSRKKLGSAPCSDLLSRSNSVILRFAIAVVLHVVLEHVTWNHTVAFLSKAFWFYTTTRDATPERQASACRSRSPRQTSDRSPLESNLGLLTKHLAEIPGARSTPAPLALPSSDVTLTIRF